MADTRHFRPLPVGPALVACALLAAAPAASQSIQSGIDTRGADTAASVASVNGACQSLVVRGADVSSRCHQTLVANTHTDGRAGFAFFEGDSAISFAGRDSAAIGGRAGLRVDEVTVTRSRAGAEQTRETIPARGTCDYTDLYAGASNIVCTAMTGEGAFSAAFRSDGHAPIVQRFQH